MNKEVHFYPTKNLFIDTLTKDINIRDCILDLVDNSVDCYVTHDVKDKREIRIDYNRESFKIFDNCGGIPVGKLINEVFRFGTETYEEGKPTIGFYGIGLKRSIFKLGRYITFETHDGKNYSKLIINVKKWLKKKEWDIPLEPESGESELKKNQKGYTSIHVEDLYPGTSDSFTTKFGNNLRKTLQRYYSLYLGKKIDFYINGEIEPASEMSITIPSGSKPAVHTDGYDKIRIKIICWLQFKPEEKRGKRGGTRGWIVFMNDRLVVSDDTSKETGWTGEKNRLPKYHQIYNEFRGLVFLNSNTPARLPINTRKTGFDTESNSYEYVLEKMVQTAKPVINFLTKKYNKDYTEIQEREEKIASEVSHGEIVTPESLEPTSLTRNQDFYPPKSYRTARMAGQDEEVPVKFLAPKKWIELAKKHLKASSPNELGLKLLKYYLDQEGLL